MTDKYFYLFTLNKIQDSVLREISRLNCYSTKQLLRTSCIRLSVECPKDLVKHNILSVIHFRFAVRDYRQKMMREAPNVTLTHEKLGKLLTKVNNEKWKFSHRTSHILDNVIYPKQERFSSSRMTNFPHCSQHPLQSDWNLPNSWMKIHFQSEHDSNRQNLWMKFL